MSHRLALAAAWRSRLVPCSERSAIRVCRVPALQKKTRRLSRLFHLVRDLRPDQCLRPPSEQNGLGFAKVGLAAETSVSEVICMNEYSCSFVLNNFPGKWFLESDPARGCNEY